MSVFSYEHVPGRTHRQTDKSPLVSSSSTPLPSRSVFFHHSAVLLFSLRDAMLYCLSPFNICPSLPYSPGTSVTSSGFVCPLSAPVSSLCPISVLFFLYPSPILSLPLFHSSSYLLVLSCSSSFFSPLFSSPRPENDFYLFSPLALANL